MFNRISSDEFKGLLAALLEDHMEINNLKMVIMDQKSIIADLLNRVKILEEKI